MNFRFAFIDFPKENLSEILLRDKKAPDLRRELYQGSTLIFSIKKGRDFFSSDLCWDGAGDRRSRTPDF